MSRIVSWIKPDSVVSTGPKMEDLFWLWDPFQTAPEYTVCDCGEFVELDATGFNFDHVCKN